jgi:hypothetical protein
MIPVGHVRELARYPVKSMAGITAESAVLGWHGLEGDRRFAFRRVNDHSGMPWLTASRLPQLLCYQPVGGNESRAEPLPTHVRTPGGACLELRSPALAAELAARFGSTVELMRLNHGIFDEAPVSVISTATIAGLGHEAGLDLDRRRFRANIVVEALASGPFPEDRWVGGMLMFGDMDPRPAIRVTLRDLRCMMINLDPETGAQDARVLKTVARLNETCAGVYATVVRPGLIRIGDQMALVPEGVESA